MSKNIIETLESIDFSLLDQNSYGAIADILLHKIPGITGFIEKAAKDKDQKIQTHFQEIRQDVINGVCSTDAIEKLVHTLSEQYTYLLSQLGVVENQLEQVEAMKMKLEDKVYGVRIATLPTIMIIDFVKTLKEANWAKIIWDEKNATKSEHITDYARLVDIFVEPNMQWSDQVVFKMLLGGYLPEMDYNALTESLGIRAPYNISTDRSPNKYG